MSTTDNLFPRDLDRQPSHRSTDWLDSTWPDGIYEVATVPECDELPYVFEMSRRQNLTFSFSSDAELSLTLCSEDDYDRWVDGGYSTEHPEGFEIHLPSAERNNFEFRAPDSGFLVAVLVNLTAQSANVVVAATLSE